MAKSVTLITQDFHPMKGGIANYLMQIYRKYFANERFQVIVPNNIGQVTDYQSLPFEVYRTDFFPFEHETPSRRQTNRTVVDILRQTNTDSLPRAAETLLSRNQKLDHTNAGESFLKRLLQN